MVTCCLAQGAQFGAHWWPRGIGWKWDGSELCEGGDKYTFLCVSVCVCVFSHFSRVRLLETLCTIAHQAPGPWDSPGENTGVDSHDLPQGISQTQGLNLHLSCFLHWQVGSCHIYAHKHTHTHIHAIPDLLCCTAETNTKQLKTNYIPTEKKRKKRKLSADKASHLFSQQKLVLESLELCSRHLTKYLGIW